MAQHPLTKYRKGADISMAALASMAGTTRQSIHRIERGGQSPSLDLVARIIKATGGKVRADDFLPRDGVAA